MIDQHYKQNTSDFMNFLHRTIHHRKIKQIGTHLVEVENLPDLPQQFPALLIYYIYFVVLFFI